MPRPKMKEVERKKRLSVSINAELVKKVKKKISNLSAYIESLIAEDLRKLKLK